MPEVLRVAVIGAQGRMGRFATQLLATHEDFEVVARVAREDDLDRSLDSSRAQLGLDLTVAGLGCEHGLRMLARGVRPVIGTSGVTAEEAARLDERARAQGLGGIVVPNFSLGAWLLQRAARDFARFLQRAEIVETHGPHKRDAPSGTALHTREEITAARGEELEVPIHSLRLPGVVARQEVHFGGRGEWLRVEHESTSLEAFAAGLLASLHYAARASGVARGLGVVLESGGIESEVIESEGALRAPPDPAGP